VALARDVYLGDEYLGVVPLVLRNCVFSSGEILEAGGTVVEFAVKMRRLSHAQRLDNMAAAGTISSSDVHALAECIVELHVGAGRSEAWRYRTAAGSWQSAISLKPNDCWPGGFPGISDARGASNGDAHAIHGHELLSPPFALTLDDDTLTNGTRRSPKPRSH
jgi:hypothetical protein